MTTEAIALLGAGALLTVIHYCKKPFGLLSPLKATGRYQTWIDNGRLHEIWTVTFRGSAVRNASTLVESLAAEGFGIAVTDGGSDSKVDDLKAVLRDNRLSLPQGKTVQALKPDGTVAAATVGRNWDYTEWHDQPSFSFGKLDEFAVVRLELISSKERPPSAAAKATFG